MSHCVFCRLNFIIPSRYFSHRPYLQQTVVVFSVFVTPSAIAPDLGDLSLQPMDFGWTFPSPCSSAVQQQVLQLSAAHACCTVFPCAIANHTRSGSYLLRDLHSWYCPVFLHRPHVELKPGPARIAQVKTTGCSSAPGKASPGVSPGSPARVWVFP